MTPRSRWLAGLAAAGSAAAAVLVAPQAGAATAAATHRVAPGQSVQAAVDAAHPGDTVELRPGTYHQTVRITVAHLTLRGAGAGAHDVRLLPPAGAAPAAVGISVSGAPGVRVEDLTVSGFAQYGIFGTHADGMTVAGVVAADNAQYGIGQEKSVHALFAGNVARGNGEAGILLANAVSEEGGALDTLGARITGNALSGNKMGVVLRRVRDMTVAANAATGNCAGVFVVGDEGLPRAGDLTVRGNVVSGNTRFCAATSRLPYVQGSGIVLTGVENTVIEGNTVTGNSGDAPMSGGVVLFHSFVGVPNTGNAIHDNLLTGNGPADIADRDTGTGNTFSGNTCAVSLPAGHC
ncbi:right-handed parallel beta-helix repeat-containing protein [Streptomyces sp. V4-01]|uniref:Right-handed parallel beta-helix repeat-containing protein n=1 Tax=Actinacidiphila polyblastidii TaxID=3110430 RepID=A0ABU7P8I7_9ACTN|nr:right-handed parallel beta-helix repeat-containing protein [Streptomyces sp. V4-01]